jgi:hypothetical protein
MPVRHEDAGCTIIYKQMDEHGEYYIKLCTP